VSRRVRWVVAALFLLLFAAGAVFVLFLRNPIATVVILQRRALDKAGFERVGIGAGPERIVGFEKGDGPPLLLLHGLGDQAGSWSAVAPALAGSWSVLAIDLPGHGDSEPREGDLKMAAVVAGAELALNRAASRGPAVVVGNSLGGWLAALLAARHPESVSRLVLVDGGPLRGEPGAPSLMPRDRREAAAVMSLVRDPSAPPIAGFVLDDVIRRAASGPIGRLSRDLPGLGAHLLDEAALAAVSTPTDLLWGASDRLVPLAYADRLLAALPAARLTTIERCGHIPQNECPERFLAALEEVLASGPQRPAQQGDDGKADESGAEPAS